LFGRYLGGFTKRSVDEVKKLCLNIGKVGLLVLAIYAVVIIVFVIPDIRQRSDRLGIFQQRLF